MRLSVFTVAYAAIAAVGTNAVDVQGTILGISVLLGERSD